jgi:hypothetical protein
MKRLVQIFPVFSEKDNGFRFMAKWDELIREENGSYTYFDYDLETYNDEVLHFADSLSAIAMAHILELQSEDYILKGV